MRHGEGDPFNGGAFRFPEIDPEVALKAEGRAGFVAYVMAGDPSRDEALEILKGLPAAGAGAALLVPPPLHAEPVYKKTTELKPGQFTWTPERAPSGPVVVLVSIPDQRVAVYRNGTLIGAALGFLRTITKRP